MRKKLALENGKRKAFRAIFVRLGKKINYKGYSEETILIKDIFDIELNSVVADHVWFSYTKGFEKLTLTKACILNLKRV